MRWTGGGDCVPVAPSSSSCDGLPGVSPAGTPSEAATSEAGGRSATSREERENEEEGELE